jgi:hypothetical protein
VTATQHDKRRAWLVATRRRNEIINLAKHRASKVERVDESRFLFVLAQTLASAPAGKFRIRKNFVTWHGLDRVTLARCAKDAGFGQLGTDDPMLTRALTKVTPAAAMGGEAAGRLLELTAEERDLLDIRTIEAVDEAREDREARRREERRLKDRERKRRAREGLHKPRALSLARVRPWETLGISKATFYRRLSVETNLSAGSCGETDLSARRICPHTYIINGYADRPVSASQAADIRRPDCPAEDAASQLLLLLGQGDEREGARRARVLGPRFDLLSDLIRSQGIAASAGAINKAIVTAVGLKDDADTSNPKVPT